MARNEAISTQGRQVQNVCGEKKHAADRPANLYVPLNVRIRDGFVPRHDVVVNFRTTSYAALNSRPAIKYQKNTYF
jgi:hypothetical protein